MRFDAEDYFAFFVEQHILPERREHADETSILGMVGAEGFEPPTLCSQSRCATRLRYAPTPKIVSEITPSLDPFPQ